MAGSAYVSTREGKTKRVEQYKGWLEDSQMIFAVPGFNLTVAQISSIRKSMPAGTKVSRLDSKST